MKHLLVALGLVLAVAHAAAQEFVAPAQPRRPVRTAPAVPDSRIAGALGAALKMSQPWQLINPFAKKGFGNGENMVATDPNQPGKPKGIILFAFEF